MTDLSHPDLDSDAASHRYLVAAQPRPESCDAHRQPLQFGAMKSCGTAHFSIGSATASAGFNHRDATPLPPNAAVQRPRGDVSARRRRAHVDVSRSAATACYVRLPPNLSNRDPVACDGLYSATAAEQRGRHLPKLMSF
jgi:hypothetical protein